MPNSTVKILFFSLLVYASSVVTAQQNPGAKILSFENIDNSPLADAALASAGNLKVTVKEFLYGYEFGPSFIKKKKESKQRYLNYLLNEKLLASDGYKRGLDKKEEYIKYNSAIKGDLASDELYKRDVLKKVKVENTEIEKAAGQKLTELSIKWLYAADEYGIKKYYNLLKTGTKFDSLYSTQLNDSVFADMRSIETDRFTLGNKNPVLAKIIDSLKAGEITPPIRTGDGWYIIRVENVWRSVLKSEAEMMKINSDVKAALSRNKADSLSDLYVKELMGRSEPVIKKRTLILLRSFIGRSTLSGEIYSAWQLEYKMKEILDSLKLKNPDEAGQLVLVELKNGKIKMKDFMDWFQFRAESIKMDKTSLKSFSMSLESLVWRMLRDELILQAAYKEHLDEMPEVKEQAAWWNDKIMYALVRDEIRNSITLPEEMKTGKKAEEKKEEEFNKKLLHKINLLKNSLKVEVNNELLDNILVEQENDNKAIEVYTAKTGGFFPRQAYPSIDLFWQNWE